MEIRNEKLCGIALISHFSLLISKKEPVQLHRFFFCYNQASSSAKFPRALACSMTLASSIWGRVS